MINPGTGILSATQNGGDMLKSEYDTNKNGVVDDAEKLGGKLPVEYAKASELEQVKTDVESLNSKIWPVGSIYLSVNSTNPATLFGGTWEQIQGRFLLAAGGGYSAGTTGGEAAHTLTNSELPAHYHTISAHFGTGGTVGGADVGTDGTNTSSLNTGSVGNGKAHNNMPPYLVVYVWKRTS